ncbi:MAG: hypothetical protein ACREL5_00980 [Gemmatimonadales bacterium]
MSFRLIAALGTAAALFGLTAAAHPPRPADPGCDATSPTAKAFLARALSTFPNLDAAGRQRLHLTAAPKTVTLVTATATCDAVIAAHNRWLDGRFRAYKVTRTPIAKAGSSYLLDLPAGKGPVEREIFVYDSTLHFVALY